MNLEPDFKTQCIKLVEHYKSRQLKSDLEPKWTHEAYQFAFDFIADLPLNEKQLWILNGTVKSHNLPDGVAVPVDKRQPQGSQRIVHDGWKAGSCTWIFMGRNFKQDSVCQLSDFWVAVQRTLPDDIYNLLDQSLAPSTLWMAYNLKLPMQVLNEKDTCVGPAIYLSQIEEAIKRKHVQE